MELRHSCQPFTINNISMASFLSLCHFPAPLQVLPGIISQINFLHAHPCLLVCIDEKAAAMII